MKSIIQFACLALSLIILDSCGATVDNREKKRKSEDVPYKTMELKPGKQSGSVRLPGVVRSFQVVQLYPKISGFIREVNVDRGSIVKKGQVLISLEAPELEQQVAAAKLKFTQAQAEYMTSKDHFRRLLETSQTPGTVSQFELEAAASKMQGDSALAQADYASYRAQESMRGYLTVRAPFDGVITERNIHPGALAGPQIPKPMLVLHQISKLRLIVDVPEQYSAQVKEGDKVQYKFNALQGQEFTGTVSRLSGSLSDKYRSETIEIDVANSNNLFKPGMFAEVVLPTSGSTNAFIVPVQSVITTTERKYIVLIEDGLTKCIDVTEGNRSNDSTEIFGGLNSGSKMLVNPSYSIKNGQKIRTQ